MSWPTTSRQSRGYGRAWELVRAEVLRRDNGLCQCSQCKGGKLLVTVAQEVHHVISKAEAARKGWTRAQIDHPSNLQAVSHACHERITLEQKSNRGSDAQGNPLNKDHPWFKERR